MTHHKGLEHPLIGVRGKATGVQEPLLQDQALGVCEVEEGQHGVQRGGSLGGGDGVHHLRPADMRGGRERKKGWGDSRIRKEEKDD